MKKQVAIYGTHAVHALLAARPVQIYTLFVLSGATDPRLQQMAGTAKNQGIEVCHQSRHQLNEQAQSEHHQGVVALCERMPTYDESDLMSLCPQNSPIFLLILDGVQDPHNLGACLRVANAMGVSAVIAPKKRAVGLTASAIKVSCGAAISTPFVQVTNLVRTMALLQEQGVWFVGADAGAELVMADVDVSGSVAVVMGAEGSGLRALTKKNCDYLVKIPMCGTVASLNVSVAAGILLHHVAKKRIT